MIFEKCIIPKLPQQLFPQIFEVLCFKDQQSALGGIGRQGKTYRIHKEAE